MRVLAKLIFAFYARSVNEAVARPKGKTGTLLLLVREWSAIQG
jgi:hypothetical protein